MDIDKLIDLGEKLKSFRDAGDMEAVQAIEQEFDSILDYELEKAISGMPPNKVLEARAFIAKIHRQNRINRQLSPTGAASAAYGAMIETFLMLNEAMRGFRHD